ELREVEALGHESAIAAEEQMSRSRVKSHEARVHELLRPGFIQRRDPDRRCSKRIARQRQVEVVAPVRQERRNQPPLVGPLLHRVGGPGLPAGCRYTMEGERGARAEEDPPIAVPGPTAGDGRLGERLRRPAGGVDTFELAACEETYRQAVRRPERER